MSLFTYTGSTVSRETIDQKEVILVPGKEIELPSGNKRVGSLLSQGLLKFSVPETDTKKDSKSEKSSDKKPEKSKSSASSSKTTKNK